MIMGKYTLKKLIASLSIMFFMVPSLGAFAQEIYIAKSIDSKAGEIYEEIRFGDKSISNYSYDIDEKEDVKEKIESMKDFKILKPKTEHSFEIALAYSNGSYEYRESAETLEDAMKKIKILEKEYEDNTIIPSLINSDGQVVYATNSMGRVWNHRNGEPIRDSSEITYLYTKPESVPDDSKAFTYINHMYVDDVPIIQWNDKVAKIQVNGYKGWINKDIVSKNYDLVVVPINQVTNPSYYSVENGSLYHYISTNMTATNSSGNSIKIGMSPSYLKEGIHYYSYDGIYFYEGETIGEGLNKLITDLKNNTNVNSINLNAPNYNYYGYLPFRTKTNYTAEELNIFINYNTESHSKLRGLGEVLIECQNKYGVNPLLALGVAINESDWGRSKIAQSNNNIFGINAVDFNPGESADSFETTADSVREFTKNYISRGYADPEDWRYFGGYLGNKQLGANVKYASDPFWGEKAAQWAYDIDLYLSNEDINNLNDYNGYRLGIYTGSNEVRDEDGKLLYNINPTISGWGGYAGNMVALKFPEGDSVGRYKIFSERTTSMDENGGLASYHGNYDWSTLGYINSENVKLVNTSKNEFIPGYSVEDSNRDEIVDIEDLAVVAIKYNETSEVNGFKKYLDINNDGIIDIFDIVKIAMKIAG